VLPSVATWTAGPSAPAFDARSIAAAAEAFRRPAHIVREGDRGRVGVAFDGDLTVRPAPNGRATYPLLATLPPLFPEWLGDRSFNEVHGVRFPYVSGAMANGIATTDLVVAMNRAGMLGFFGSAGLSFRRVEEALGRLEAALGPSWQAGRAAWGMNLIHSPNEPALEEAVADLYIRRGVTRVSAAAYLALTPAIVRYAATGLHLGPDGRVARRNYVFAKISRPETARHFMRPAPVEILDGLVARGLLSAGEAALARRVPVAEDYTVEADSGGHTDKQALTAVFPVIATLRDAIADEEGYDRPIRVGAAGGLGTPRSVAAAFSLGAAYVLTGSVNQSSLESGLSDEGKRMLAQAEMTDIQMAPAADMFEMGVEVQVLKRGTMFANRAQRLYEVYRTHDGLDAIAPALRARLEKTVLGASLDAVRAETRKLLGGARPGGERQGAPRPTRSTRWPSCFRWYLGLSRAAGRSTTARPRGASTTRSGAAPRWAPSTTGWTKGSFLEPPENRGAVQIAPQPPGRRGDA
jgi:trans-AT polyketide synthase/acyltransferase/oxidoreductase domain-containing protein